MRDVHQLGKERDLVVVKALLGKSGGVASDLLVKSVDLFFAFQYVFREADGALAEAKESVVDVLVRSSQHVEDLGNALGERQSGSLQQTLVKQGVLGFLAFALDGYELLADPGQSPGEGNEDRNHEDAEEGVGHGDMADDVLAVTAKDFPGGYGVDEGKEDRLALVFDVEEREHDERAESLYYGVDESGSPSLPVGADGGEVRGDGRSDVTA